MSLINSVRQQNLRVSPVSGPVWLLRTEVNETKILELGVDSGPMYGDTQQPHATYTEEQYVGWRQGSGKTNQGRGEDAQEGLCLL